MDIEYMDAGKRAATNLDRSASGRVGVDAGAALKSVPGVDIGERPPDVPIDLWNAIKVRPPAHLLTNSTFASKQ